MALVCLCRGNFYWPPHTTILFCSIFLDKIVLDTLKSRYHRSAPLGMQSIDKSYFESALLDGAGWVQRTRYITVPAIRPIIAPAVIITIFTTFKQFDVIYLLTQQAGAKTGAHVHTILTYAYENAFISNNYGYSSAISIIIFALLIAFSARYRLQEEGSR